MVGITTDPGNTAIPTYIIVINYEKRCVGHKLYYTGTKTYNIQKYTIKIDIDIW